MPITITVLMDDVPIEIHSYPFEERREAGEKLWNLLEEYGIGIPSIFGRKKNVIELGFMDIFAGSKKIEWREDSKE